MKPTYPKLDLSENNHFKEIYKSGLISRYSISIVAYALSDQFWLAQRFVYRALTDTRPVE